jgi:DNA-binding transcriptional MerR regulator
MTDSTFESDLADIRRFIEELGAERAEIQRQTAEARQARATEEEELAEKRRAGELGRDWQVLQQRIDMRTTTVDDIVNGLDHSPEARAVRAMAGTNLAAVRDAYAAQVNDPNGPLSDAVGRLEEAQRRLARTLAAASDPAGDR